MDSVKVNLNLASQPFGQRRLFWLGAGIAAAVLTVVAGGLVMIFLQSSGASAASGEEAALRSQLSALLAEETQLRSKLEESGNEQVLARSLFLNELLYRKGISWTRTFADLEDVLPPRVRVVSVRPEVAPDNDVLLDMQVGAETQPDFIELLRALEESALFGSYEVPAFSPPTDNNPLYQYRLLVSYEQEL